MGKKTKALLAIMMLCCITLLSGCGVGDKFAGKWIGFRMGDSVVGNHSINIFNIKKNGEGYLIQRDLIEMPYTRYSSEYNELLNTISKTGNKEIKFDWKIQEGFWKNLSAAANHNDLVVTNNQCVFTYIEDEKKLQFRDPFWGGDMLLQKYDEKVMKELEKEVIEKRTELIRRTLNIQGVTFVPNEKKNQK